MPCILPHSPLPAEPRPALQLVSSTPNPEPPVPPPPPSVFLVPRCRRGVQWTVSRRLGIVEVLAGPTEVVGRRLAEALAVYTDQRPNLTVAGGAR